MQSYSQSLQDGNHRRHHAEFADVGRATLKANTRYRHDCDLIPGIDCQVKSKPDPRWLPFPDIPSTQHFRHTWIIEKRCRPVAPVFVGSPFPMKRHDSSERSALLTMAYFHPWTLKTDYAQEDHVPFAGRLRIFQHGKNILPLG